MQQACCTNKYNRKSVYGLITTRRLVLDIQCRALYASAQIKMIFLAYLVMLGPWPSSAFDPKTQYAVMTNVWWKSINAYDRHRGNDTTDGQTDGHIHAHTDGWQKHNGGAQGIKTDITARNIKQASTNDSPCNTDCGNGWRHCSRYCFYQRCTVVIVWVLQQQWAYDTTITDTNCISV